jgi:phage terminase large subunit-like protein
VANEYQPGECSYCRAATWVETRANGSHQCRGCKIIAFFRWMYRHIGYELLTWQERELRSLYGTVDRATGLRRFQRGYLEIPKKNGKTFLVGGLPIYHLVAEGVRKPEAYGTASTKEQAALVFKAAKELIEPNPELRKRLRVLPSVKRIVQRDGAGFYQVLSSDGKGADGVEPSLILKDEVHRWSGAKAETLWDILSKGTISREETLEVMTTTAGAEDESLIWNNERDFARAVIAGEIESPGYYASIYQADERRVAEEPGYWESREARVQANPSHEDNGGFLKDTKIVEELAKAQKQGKRNEYLRYHLGIRASGTQENAIDIPQWIASNKASEVDLKTWPAYDFELLVRKWNLIERTAVVGVDASWSIDLSAVSVVFPPLNDDIWRLLLFYFMPQDMIERRKTVDQVPYDEWARRGFITASEGNTIDYETIKARIRWACEMFDVREVGYDKWNFRATAMDLLNEGLPMVEVGQNFGQLTEPTKTLLGAYLDCKLWHGNNPVLLFNARSLALQYDRKDNVQPAKPERLKTKKRIDGIAATVTGMNRAMSMVQSVASPWSNAETAVM